jgi:hypothetical protein
MSELWVVAFLYHDKLLSADVVCFEVEETHLKEAKAFIPLFGKLYAATKKSEILFEEENVSVETVKIMSSLGYSKGDILESWEGIDPHIAFCPSEPKLHVVNDSLKGDHKVHYFYVSNPWFYSDIEPHYVNWKYINSVPY